MFSFFDAPRWRLLWPFFVGAVEQDAEVSAREAIKLWRANTSAWLQLSDVLVDMVRVTPNNRYPKSGSVLFFQLPSNNVQTHATS